MANAESAASRPELRKAFDVNFQNKEGKLQTVWQTSWGVSTPLVGGLIMTHSDDKGLVLPPRSRHARRCWCRFIARMKSGISDGSRDEARGGAGRASGCSRRPNAGHQVFPLGSPRVAWGVRAGPAIASGKIVIKQRDPCSTWRMSWDPRSTA